MNKKHSVKILQWGLTPDIFNLGYIFPIPKKGTFTPENSRPISLLEVHLKLLTRIVTTIPTLTTLKTLHRYWLVKIKTEFLWSVPALAEDWVRINILSHLTILTRGGPL